LKISIPLF